MYKWYKQFGFKNITIPMYDEKFNDILISFVWIMKQTFNLINPNIPEKLLSIIGLLY